MATQKNRKTPIYFVKKVLSFIPGIVWGIFAVIGILFVGLMLGYSVAADPNYTPSELQASAQRNKELLRLVDGYEDLSNLYQIQGQNVGVVLDRDIALTHPEEIDDAYDSMSQYKNMIQLQYGRIIEMRHDAGLPEDVEKKD